MDMTTSVQVVSRAAEAGPRFSDYLELTKPRLSLMSVVSAVLGYFAAGPRTDMLVFGGLLCGTTLAAFGAAALNQWWEREADARMQRTSDRPVAAGRVSAQAALVYGVLLSVAGVALMYAGTNWVASALTAATVLLYVLAYTPLKKITPWATEIGAIPGALPPLIGWVAAGAGFSGLGWILFAFLFAWQIPHFMAISWNLREDYRAAGFRMLAVDDAHGARVAIKSLVWTVLLVAVSLLPAARPEMGWLFAVVAVLLGVYMLVPAVRFACGRERSVAARKLFVASIVYLPLYLMALVVDRFLF